MNETEFQIRDQIFDYLKKTGVFAWKDKQESRKPGRGTMRTSRGVADILGIYKGRPLAIEVKKPDGTLSAIQWKWLTQHRNAGGITIVATSVEDVQKEIK